MVFGVGWQQNREKSTEDISEINSKDLFMVWIWRIRKRDESWLTFVFLA